MKRTSLVTVLVLAVIGAAGAGLIQSLLANAGRPIITAPVTLPLALAAIGAILIALALPIRRMTQSGRQRDVAPRRTAALRQTAGPVDPFYATRVVMLAKASALTGALFTGAGAGMLVYLLTRSAIPGTGAVGAAVAALVGSAVLLACGLVAESMCRIPPSDDDDEDGDQPVREQP